MFTSHMVPLYLRFPIIQLLLASFLLSMNNFFLSPKVVQMELVWMPPYMDIFVIIFSIVLLSLSHNENNLNL